MRQNISDLFQNATRQVTARALVSKDHPNFTEFPSPATTFVQFASEEAVDLPGFIRTYGLKTGSTNIFSSIFNASYYAQYVLNPQIPKDTINRIESIFAPMPAGSAATEEDRSISAAGGYVYAALNGSVYRWNGSGWSAACSLADADLPGITPKIALAAVSATVVIAAAAYKDIGGKSISDHCKLFLLYYNGTTWSKDQWKGFLPKHSAKPGITAAVDSGGTYHIYVDNWSKNKPRYIRRYYSGVWSATKEILPMDALDDENDLEVGFATRLSSGRIFLTGQVRRKYGPAYVLYMLGPDKFTYGRDLIAVQSYAERMQLFIIGDAVWMVGRHKIYASPAAASIFSDITPTSEIDLHSFSADFAVNQADRLSLEVPGHFFTDFATDLVPGARLDLAVEVNGEEETIGRYGIDRFRKIENDSGESWTVDCTSHAMKRLLDWESDSYFDYLAQAEVHGDPGDLTKVIRVSGGKYTTPEGSGLKLESLNTDGLLYTTPGASHGGFMRCKFTNMQTTNTMVGVGANYGEETMAEAAKRLKKKIEQVTASERGRWGMFAVYNPDKSGATAGYGTISLVDWNTIRTKTVDGLVCPDPYRIITSKEVSRPAANGTAWLALSYQDGYVRVYYASSDTPSMALVLSCEAQVTWDVHPVEHENYGRGALFVRNNSGFHMSYPLMSDSDVVPLYATAEKFKKYGIPLEDRLDKFPASGTLQIDSEKVLYTGIAGWGNGTTGHTDRRTLDLAHMPGKIIAKSWTDTTIPPTGGSVLNFASSRGTRTGTHVHGNNYLLQGIKPVVGSVLFAVRIWIKKINYPEDGLTLTINTGNVSSSAAATALVNNVIASSSAGNYQLKNEGGWVTFYLDKDITISAGVEYWMVLKRGKNHTHPASTSYFAAYKLPDASYPNAGTYLYCEEDDQAIGQVGDIAFQAYARPDGLNKEFHFCVKYETGKYLPTSDPAQTYFNGCALTITSGLGINNCYRIVRSWRHTDSLCDLYVFALDRDPGRVTFDQTTRARAVPAFYGLTRGTSSTLAAAHGANSMVHMPMSVFALSSYFEHYTAEEDLTLAEVAEDLARKAGVVETDKANRHPGSTAGTPTPNIATLPKVPAQSKNCIVRLELPTMAADPDEAAVSFLDAGNAQTMTVRFYVSQILDPKTGTNKPYGHIAVYTYVGITPTLALSLPFDENAKGEYRVSLYDGHFSVWLGERFLGGVHLGANLKAWTQVCVWLKQTTPTGSAQVLIPQAGTRVESFVMDMGKTGAQLLQALVGEKRIYYHDDGQGRLKIYTDRETVPGTYTRAISTSKEVTDIGLATRILLEGGEVVEVSNAGNLRDYGNFFKTFNFSEINNLDDATYFAALVLEDMSLNRERVNIEGAVDLRIEPTDKFTATIDGVNETVVVDSVSHAMHVDEQEAVYDMRIAGRMYP